MLVKLTKINSVNENLRTKDVLGDAPFMPELGRSFVVFSESLTEDNDYRQVTTSVVKSIKKISTTKIVINTMNSTYEIEFLD
jgi:hypothetical protein